MKKIIFSLSLLMSIIGTTNSFGTTNKDKNHNQSKTAVTVINHNTSVKNAKNTTCTCKRFVEDPLTKGSNCIELNKKKQTEKQMAGGYTHQRNLTKQDKQLFKNTYKGKDKLTPISVSTQVVNGTNYKFICKDKHGKMVTVIIYQSLPHMGSKSKIVSINK